MLFLTLFWSVQGFIVRYSSPVQRHHIITQRYPHPALKSIAWYHCLPWYHCLLLISSILDTDDLSQVTILFIPSHLSTELLCSFISSSTKVKKENLHWHFKSKFCNNQLWHPVIKKFPILYNFGSCCFILPSSKTNNWLVLRGFVKTVKTVTVLESRAWVLTTLPTKCCDNFDIARQIWTTPSSSLVVLPNSNSWVTVWIHNPSQNRTSTRTADATITQIINHENFLTCLLFP